MMLNALIKKKSQAQARRTSTIQMQTSQRNNESLHAGAAGVDVRSACIEKVSLFTFSTYANAQISNRRAQMTHSSRRGPRTQRAESVPVPKCYAYECDCMCVCVNVCVCNALHYYVRVWDSDVAKHSASRS